MGLGYESVRPLLAARAGGASFERVVTLPEGLDLDKINAKYENGVLEITAPLAASAQPKRIEVKTSSSSTSQSSSSSSKAATA